MSRRYMRDNENCYNTPGSFVCVCPDGFEEAEDTAHDSQVPGLIRASSRLALTHLLQGPAIFLLLQRHSEHQCLIYEKECMDLAQK